MKKTRLQFTHDQLLEEVKKSISKSLERYNVEEKQNSRFSNFDCLMSGLAVFAFKCSSLLKFDRTSRMVEKAKNNLKQLFNLEKTPCDTHVRTRLDIITPDVLRSSFKKIFALLQRGKVLEHYRFLDKYYLVSGDGTGVFSSNSVHCKHCCEKVHNRGKENEYTSYHHQIFAVALVHPDQKVVFPLAPEPILKEDGAKKNDCERNALKRWIGHFRREHPHLPVVFLGDGLHANAPSIRELNDHKMRYLIVCKEGDHSYLFNWINNFSEQEVPILKRTEDKITHEYQHFHEVPLNGDEKSPIVTMIRYKETKIVKGEEKTTKWTWVTDLEVTDKNIKEVVKGARSRFHIENQTFNTLKNQGYEFEHNFGHGKKHLTYVFSMFMMLAFLMDQCLQKLNRRFQEALTFCGAKKYLWQHMLHNIYVYDFIPNFETLYDLIVRPPPVHVKSVI